MVKTEFEVVRNIDGEPVNECVPGSPDASAHFKSIASKISAQMATRRISYAVKTEPKKASNTEYLDKLEKELVRNDDSLIHSLEEEKRDPPRVELAHDMFEGT